MGNNAEKFMLLLQKFNFIAEFKTLMTKTMLKQEEVFKYGDTTVVVPFLGTWRQTSGVLYDFTAVDAIKVFLCLFPPKQQSTPSLTWHPRGNIRRPHLPTTSNASPLWNPP